MEKFFKIIALPILATTSLQSWNYKSPVGNHEVSIDLSGIPVGLFHLKTMGLGDNTTRKLIVKN